MGYTGQIDSSNYMSQFMNYYNQNQNNWQNNWTNLMNNWNSGFGKAGLGMYDLGNAGMGKYDSDLLNKLSSRISSNLTNPNASLAMGMAKDQMAGSELSQRQGLADRFAGWGRGSGIRQAAESGLTRDMGRTSADTYRQIAMDTERDAIANAAGLEGMKGGFYNDAMARELQNRMGQGGFYSDAMGRELQNAGMNKDWLLGMGGLLGNGMGDMGDMSNMIQWQAGMDVSERDKWMQWQDMMNQSTQGAQSTQGTQDRDLSPSQAAMARLKNEMQMRKYMQEMTKFKNNPYVVGGI